MMLIYNTAGSVVLQYSRLGVVHACSQVSQLSRLIAFCRQQGMEPLVEVHTDQEMEIALDAGARVIGVNNRNLHTFELDLATTERVAQVARKRGIR